MPADPALPTSRQEVRQQPGQVWYPNTAYKTAQAIQDMNFGEEVEILSLSLSLSLSHSLCGILKFIFGFSLDFVFNFG